MQLRFFTIPVLGAEATTNELNRFLSGHRILAIDRQFVADGAASLWAVCISFDEGHSVQAPRLTEPAHTRVAGSRYFISTCRAPATVTPHRRIKPRYHRSPALKAIAAFANATCGPSAGRGRSTPAPCFPYGLPPRDKGSR